MNIVKYILKRKKKTNGIRPILFFSSRINIHESRRASIKSFDQQKGIRLIGSSKSFAESETFWKSDTSQYQHIPSISYIFLPN